MKRDSVLSLISIAKKAGRIAAGEFQTENAVKSGAATLVIISSEASKNTEKKFRNMCAFYEVPVAVYGEKEALGMAIGCEFRATLAVLDQGLGKSVRQKLENAGVTVDDGGCVNGADQGA